MEREGKTSARLGMSGWPSENVDEGQGSQTSTRKLVQTTQGPEVEYSQVRRQERAQNSNPWKRDNREVIFALYQYKETRTGSNSKNRVSKREVHEPSVHDEGLPFLTKQVGNYSGTLNISDGSIEDTCADNGECSCLRQ